jgi:hypothetical protein
MVFVDSADIKPLAARLNLKPADRSANVTLWKPYDESVLFAAKEIDGIKIVSPVQLYLALNNYPGRGKEAAEAILEEVIRPSWKI